MSAANIFEALRDRNGNQDNEDALNFEPNPNSRHFVPTAAPAGSLEKMAVLRRRLTLGLPLWHPQDNPLAVRVNQSIDRVKKQTRKEKREAIIAECAVEFD